MRPHRHERHERNDDDRDRHDPPDAAGPGRGIREARRTGESRFGVPIQRCHIVLSLSMMMTANARALDKVPKNAAELWPAAWHAVWNSR
jgi:hypothetical protein